MNKIPFDPVKITKRINETIENLPSNLLSWTKTHFVKLRLIEVASSPDGPNDSIVVQVTGDSETEDSAYWIYYDITADMFGLICILENGCKWKMGLYGEFDETMQNM